MWRLWRESSPASPGDLSWLIARWKRRRPTPWRYCMHTCWPNQHWIWPKQNIVEISVYTFLNEKVWRINLMFYQDIAFCVKKFTCYISLMISNRKYLSNVLNGYSIRFLFLCLLHAPDVTTLNSKPDNSNLFTGLEYLPLS